MLDKICDKIPQLDGSKGCSVALWHTYLKSRPGASEQWHHFCDAERFICSKCIITKSLEVARKLWPCERCSIRPANSKEDYKLHPCHNCPDCHGFGIAVQAFIETCPDCNGTGGQMPIRCKPCCGMGQIKREPWAVVAKLIKHKTLPGYKDLEDEARKRKGYGYICRLEGQFFQLFELWDRLRDLTGEAGDGREE